jgi:hypothetical protein
MTIDPSAPVLVIFGQFGEKEYADYEWVDPDFGVISIVCRWCVGEGEPDRKCAACKNARRMWIGL